MFTRVGGLPCTCTTAVSYYFEYQTTFVNRRITEHSNQGAGRVRYLPDRAQGKAIVFGSFRCYQTAVFTPDSLAHVHITNTFGVRWHMHACSSQRILALPSGRHLLLFAGCHVPGRRTTHRLSYLHLPTLRPVLRHD